MRKPFDLTPAETVLALAISKNAARPYLRAIFSKTGITRQATLVRMSLNSGLSLG
ncbi:hypothetical protein [Burkholderia seminalis]|uniref:hypothetical protein n=1 Tax=Burkholderia seminalis TaxID=488731 RepID=UPI0021AB90ED|nr:hypothetical protein [Burkholderia seminalis]